MTNRRQIYCCGCGQDETCWLTDGREIYPHRPDLAALPFWKCTICGNYVGCHHKTKDWTRPLGNVPTKEIRAARKHIHARLDPLWKTRRLTRSAIYQRLSDVLGREYHTAELRSITEARAIYAALIVIERDVAAAEAEWKK